MRLSHRRHLRQDAAMKRPGLLPILIVPGLLAACSSGPSREESARIFAAATTAMASAQSRAVADAGSALRAPADLLLDFTGACTLGGSISLTGSYTGDADTDTATFELTTRFDGCRELQGTLDGDLRWTSVATETGATTTMKGVLVWDGSDGSATCELDVQTTVSATGFSYSGSICGHDAASSATWRL
jgi:hypothetical protein